MKTIELRDKSMSEINLLDFMNISLTDNGSLLITHVDKFNGRDYSKVLVLRPEEVNELKEFLNE